MALHCSQVNTAQAKVAQMGLRMKLYHVRYLSDIELGDIEGAAARRIEESTAECSRTVYAIVINVVPSKRFLALPSVPRTTCRFFRSPCT